MAARSVSPLYWFCFAIAALCIIGLWAMVLFPTHNSTPLGISFAIAAFMALLLGSALSRT